MEFFLEMLLTAVVAVLFSFFVAKLVSVSMDGNSGEGVNDQTEETEIGVGDRFVAAEELCSGLKVGSPVVVVADENVEDVERFGREADRVVDEVVDEEAKGGDFVEAGESSAAVSPENVVAEEMIEDEQRDSGKDKVSEDREEFIVRTVDEAESTASVSPGNVKAEEFIVRGQEEGSESTERRSGEVVGVAESEEVSVEESNTVEESEHKMESNTEEEVELRIEEEEDDDDDWEAVERSELEKDFATASNLLEESGKAQEFGDEVKMELYGLHKIATEGSCRETQPMAIMVSARAKWNAWQKLGNMSQEEAMEQYLALVSKEIPGLINPIGNIQETETSDVLPPNSGSLDDPTTTLGTTGVAFSKNVSAER